MQEVQKTPKGETWGQRMVMVVGQYEDGERFAEYLPEGLAELFVAAISNGWSPYELEVERRVRRGEEVAPGSVNSGGKRVVSTKIEYGEVAPSVKPRSPEEAMALAALLPDIQIDPRYDRRRPLL